MTKMPGLRTNASGLRLVQERSHRRQPFRRKAEAQGSDLLGAVVGTSECGASDPDPDGLSAHDRSLGCRGGENTALQRNLRAEQRLLQLSRIGASGAILQESLWTRK